MHHAEQQRVVILGAGLAGSYCALRIKQRHPEWRVRLADHTGALLSAFRRMAPIAVPPVGLGVAHTAHERVYRGREFARQIFHRFDEADFLNALAGGHCENAAPIEPARAADRLARQVEQAGVEFSPDRKATEVSKGGDGLFRIWFDIGNPWEGHALVLATGGARNRAFTWAEEWGHRSRRGSPAFLGLRLTENRWRGLRRVRWADATVHWQDPASEQRYAATGSVVWQFPFLEGSAIAALTAQAIEPLRAVHAKGKLELELHALKERGLSASSLQQQVQQGGSRAVAEDPQGGLDPAFWRELVCGSRIAPTEGWARLSRKQLQTLVSHLSRLTVKFAGYRQWRDEFSIQGGLDLDQFDPTTMESRCIEKLFAAGELLDFDGAPGGTNLHLAMASAVVAADGVMARLER